MPKFEYQGPYPVNDQMQERLQNTFTYHKPKDDQPARYERIRDKALELAIVITANTPPSREQSIALTDLEKVVMMANVAIARNE